MTPNAIRSQLARLENLEMGRVCRTSRKAQQVRVALGPACNVELGFP